MKKIFLMQPRQSGKTTKAIYEYIKDPENTIFVTHSLTAAHSIYEKLGGRRDNFLSSKQFINRIRGVKIKNLILDEYMFFSKKDEIYKDIKHNVENLYIYSTSDKTYKTNIFNFVKENKLNFPLSDVIEMYDKKFCRGNITAEIEKEIYDLYYNFLTDYDTVLIDTCYNYDMSDKSHLIGVLGKEQYATQIINCYLSDY